MATTDLGTLSLQSEVYMLIKGNEGICSQDDKAAVGDIPSRGISNMGQSGKQGG